MPASARRASTSRSCIENIRALADAVQKAKPTGAKGTYLQKAALSSSQGPGIRVDVSTLLAAAAE